MRSSLNKDIIITIIRGFLIILWSLITGIRLYSYLPRYNIKTLNSLFSDFSLFNILINLEKLFIYFYCMKGYLSF